MIQLRKRDGVIVLLIFAVVGLIGFAGGWGMAWLRARNDGTLDRIEQLKRETEEMREETQRLEKGLNELRLKFEIEPGNRGPRIVPPIGDRQVSYQERRHAQQS